MSEKTIESVYLDKLEYDENLERSAFRFFLDRARFLFLLIAIILIAGLIALKSLPLESQPEVQIGMATVVTTLPGASPEVMEDLVTKKLEKEISKIHGIDTINSNSQNSVSVITVQFKSDVNIETAMRDFKDKVDLTKPNLPQDANDPIVKEVSFSDQPVWILSIAGNYSGFELYAFAQKIQEELEKNTLVSEVTISGGDQTEFSVFVDPKKLDAYGLSLDVVNGMLKAENFTLPIGDLKVGDYTHVLTVDERYYSTEKIGNLAVAKLGNTGIVHLSDIARIEETPKKRTTISRLSYHGSTPENAVTLGVVKKRWGSIVNLVSEGESTLESMRQSGIIPQGLKFTTILDQAERIKLDLSHLIRDGLLTILLVFATLFLVIGVKEALVAGASAPLVFLITFAVMSVAGQTLNFLSMFALILSLGLLVDDAIVIISAINQYKRTGKFSTRQAALLVLRDYRMVLISTTLTVVWIFSAMLFMTWIIGKFIFSIPFIITVTLLSSLVVALTINPALAVIFDRIGEGKKPSRWSRYLDAGFINLEKIENWYAQIITGIVSSRKKGFRFLVFTIVLFISALLLPITGILRSEFFPQTDQDLLFIDLEAEPGTDLWVTSDIVRQAEVRLLSEKEIQSFSTTIGGTSQFSGWAPQNGNNFANIAINLIKKEYGRKESSMSIADRLRKDFDTGIVKNAKVTVSELKWGPPAGSDFQVQITGSDFSVMERIATDVKKKLATIPGAINIASSRRPLPLEFRLSFDPNKLALYDLTLPQVSLFVKNAIDGAESTKIFKGTDEIIVRTRFETGSVDTMDKINDLKLKNQKGQDIYLRDIMSNELSPSVFSITRTDQKRVITVSASASKGTTGGQILAEYNAKMTGYKLPSGYEFVFGGANDENAKSVTSLLVAMVFGLLFIIATLVVLFDSYRQSVLVLVTIPLSLIGVFYGLTIFGQPLSFPGLIGLVALFGIVVRNGIILFDKVNLNIREHIPFTESIIDAGKTRLEPVLLTSVCTILGMIPLTFSNPTWTSLGLSIIFGLATSTVFTLLVLPTLYFLFIKDTQKISEK